MSLMRPAMALLVWALLAAISIAAAWHAVVETTRERAPTPGTTLLTEAQRVALEQDGRAPIVQPTHGTGLGWGWMPLMQGSQPTSGPRWWGLDDLAGRWHVVAGPYGSQAACFAENVFCARELAEPRR